MAEKVTLIPERNKVLSNKRLNKRQTTLRAFTFTRDWVSPIPIIPALNQVNVSSQNTSNSPEDVAIETASSTIQHASSDYDEISSGPTSIHQRTPSPQTKTSQARLHGNSVLESTRLSDMATEEVRANSNITLDENKGMGETNEVSQPPETDKTLKNANRSTRRSSRLKTSWRHNATEIEHHDNSHVHNQSRLIGHSLSTLKNVDNTDVPDRSSQSRNASRVTDNYSPEDDGSEPVEQEMPDSILTDTSLTQVLPKNDELSSTPKRPKITSNKGKTTPLLSSMAIPASPKSGPAFRHRGELNRKSPPQRNDQQEPLPKGKVCLWTASERNRSANDVNELDVVLSNIENECLNFREELTEKPHKKAVSRFFVNTKKDFTAMIALRQEQKFLQSAVRKAKTDVNKKRKLLLALKKQDSRLTVDIDHLKKKQSGKHNALKTITEFLDGLKEFQMKIDKIQEDSDDATIHKNNIPALLIESAQFSKVNISL